VFRNLPGGETKVGVRRKTKVIANKMGGLRGRRQRTTLRQGQAHYITQAQQVPERRSTSWGIGVMGSMPEDKRSEKQQRRRENKRRREGRGAALTHRARKNGGLEEGIIRWCAVLRRGG